MSTRKDNFYNLLENSELLNEVTLTELERLLIEYPYFQTAILLYVKNLEQVQHSSYKNKLGKAATLVADRKRLFYFLSKNDYSDFINEYTINHKKDNLTNLLLGNYLNSLDDDLIHETEINNVTNDLISTDYLYYLRTTEQEESEGNEHQLKHHNLIDSFLEKAETTGVFRPKNDNATIDVTIDYDNNEDDERRSRQLNEIMAQIYIKQKKYEQALTIIKRLSLDIPEKSVYFADQIRFLEYLIINEKNKKKQ